MSTAPASVVARAAPEVSRLAATVASTTGTNRARESRGGRMVPGS